jgi:hypothetical protein
MSALVSDPMTAPRPEWLLPDPAAAPMPPPKAAQPSVAATILSVRVMVAQPLTMKVTATPRASHRSFFIYILLTKKLWPLLFQKRFDLSNIFFQSRLVASGK